MTGRRPSARAAGERGAALILVLITSAAMAALAAALVVAATTDTLVTGSYRAAQEALYALEAGSERAMGELAGLPDWSVLLSAPPGNRTASFDTGMGVVTAPDGRTFSATALTAARQAASDATRGPAVFGADSPAWRLFARASLQSILPGGLVAQPGLVLVWVADDGGDGDGDAARDANGQVLLHVEAYGVAGTRRGVDLSLGRAAPGGIRLLSWKEMR